MNRSIFILFIAMIVLMDRLLCNQISDPLHAADSRTLSQEIECSISPIIRNQTRDKRISPVNFIKEALSTNWSGYVAVSTLAKPSQHSVSFVSGSWTIPRLKATSTNSYSSNWVGIDGYLSSTVEQIGTESDWVVSNNGGRGAQINYVWFEMYPLGSYKINGFPANIGDHITASVEYIGDDRFEMIIENATQHVYFIVPTSYTQSRVAERSSAEWVIEAPYYNRILPLANFGITGMTKCIATINGVTGPISNANWESDSIQMVTNKNIPKAKPSILQNVGQAFTVTWQHL